MLKIEYTNRMKRDVKRMAKRGKDMSDHSLKGEMAGYRECHIEPDWLLIYQVIEERLILVAAGTGTHSDLFDE